MSNTAWLRVVTPAQIQKLADRTADAYSCDRYASWKACAAALRRRGFTVRQTEEILRSKLPRWAADRSKAARGRATAADLMRFIDQCPRDTGAVLAEAQLLGRQARAAIARSSSTKESRRG